VTQAEIFIGNDVILDGGGNLTVDANQTHHRVFSVGSGVTAELREMTVTGGLTYDGGGGIYNAGKLTLTNSTVSGNSAEWWPFTRYGGGVYNDGVLTLMTSTVSNNTTHGSGGGIDNWGVVTLTNSTVSGNTAGYGGGLWNDGTLTLTNSTVSGNTTEFRVDGQQIGFCCDVDVYPALTLTNSLVDGDCQFDITSGGYNIESPGNTCGFDTNKGDQVSVSADDLRLGPLRDNRGPTMTHALLPDSVAIDVIPVEDCVDADGQRLTTDQRGEPRPGATMCDVGAFEVQP